MKKYYDIHVSNGKDGFSIPFKVETEKRLSEQEVIDEAVKEKKLDSEDAKYVDNVEEIDEEEYNYMKGI
jgi:hypothetical protein